VQPAALSGTLASIAAATGIIMDPQSWVTVSGGDISQAAHLHDTGDRRWFIKLNDLQHGDMFAAECAGLRELATAKDICVPEVAGYGSSEQFAWLVLEWLDLAGLSGDTDHQLGQALAGMHRLTAANFGWSRDNYIGTTTQANGWACSWPDFFREQRLGPQLARAQQNGAADSVIETGRKLMVSLDNWFGDYVPVPSLLHGDLWSGNRGALADGSPVLYDPAAYYGDREADIAMTRLFGGYSEAFYAAYDKEWPMDEGAKQRQELYNLYHVLNHFNLFGGSYLMQAEQIMQRLLSAQE
jgi:protein-ribulosamine 3-kinase